MAPGDLYHTPTPVAPRDPAVRDLHGERVADDYGWMRDPRHPALREYLAAERAYYEAHTRHLDALARRLTAEAASRLPDGDEYSVSWPVRGYSYRTRLPAGSDYRQLLRSGPGESQERVLLDENLLAALTGYIEIGTCEPSPDGALLAWSADSSGAENYELRIRDLETGEDLPEVLSPTYPGIAWGSDSRYLFYLVPDELHRPFQVWRHAVDTPAKEDELLWQEDDQKFELTLRRSRSGALAIVTSAARDTTEVRVIDLERDRERPVVVEPRRRGVEYRIDHAPEALFIVTDRDEPEFTLMRASRAGAAWEPVHCEAIAPARADTRLVACEVFARHLLLSVRRDGAPLLVIADHDAANVREIPAATAAGSIRVEHAEDYERGSVIIVEESMIDPPAWYELDLATGERALLKRLEVPGYDPAGYRTERLAAPAPDGASIPVTLAHRHDVGLDGRAPCLLVGYGAYEASYDPEFDRSLPSLLDRGVVVAIAHIRGGGERGRAWWQQGRLDRKRTTFTDFLAVADWLAGAGGGPALVDGERIVSRGGSAGGLLQGAVFSMRPQRWRAVVAEVPFVDVVSTMLDESIPLTANEWDEWGDPRQPDDYAYMRSYSPYDNPPAGPRPALLVTGAVNDARVGIHEPAKWVARLRASDTTGSRLLFKAELGVGAHSGPSGRSARLRYEAEIQAFILDAMGITE